MDKASVLLWSVAGDGGSSPPEGGHLLLIFIKIKNPKKKFNGSFTDVIKVVVFY